MPYSQPNQSEVHVNRPLTNLSVAYMQSEDRFVSRRVFPRIGSQKQSNSYFTFPRGEFNRVMMQRRAPGAESAGARYKIARETFTTEPWALHNDIDDQVRANVDDPLKLDMQTTKFLTLNALLHEEISWASSYFKAGVWSGGGVTSVENTRWKGGAAEKLTGTDRTLKYWNVADTTPIQDIRFMKRTILEDTGFFPNKLTMGRVVYDTLLDHPTIIGRLDRGQTSGPAMASRQQLAALFEVDEICVMDAIQNTAAEGLDDKHSFIAGKHILLTYSPSAPGLMTPSAGYTFTWDGFLGSNNGTRIRRFRMIERSSDRIELEMAFEHKVVGSDLGFFVESIIQ